MELSFVAGIAGSLVLLVGAIWPLEKTLVPAKSIRNRLFAIGSFIMLLYAIFGYLAGGPVFYIVLELVVMLAVALMFLGTSDRLNTGLICVAGILLMVRSWFLFQWPSMLLFILAFTILWLGYAYKMHTARRFFFLAIGGGLISLSSYLDASRIFFWLNIFFALFSLLYAIKLIGKHSVPAAKKPVAKKPAKKK